MDTDDLSNETYNAVIRTSDKFDRNLTIEFGFLAYQCINDDDFLNKSKAIIQEWKADLQNSFTDILGDYNKSNIISFENTLDKIVSNIESVLDLPIEKHIFDI